MAKIEKVPTGEFHSGYGCFIIAAAAAMFGFIIWWGWYSLVTMDAAMAAIAQDKPVELVAIAPAPELEKKLVDFAEQSKDGKIAELKLSIAELNAIMLLLPTDGSAGYKDMLRIKSSNAANHLLTADCSLPMNTARFWEDTKRYLVGEVDFKVDMTEAGPDARVSALRVPGKTVPQEMVNGMMAYGYLGPYQSHPTIGPVLKAIQQVKVEADGVWLSTEPEKK